MTPLDRQRASGGTGPWTVGRAALLSALVAAAVYANALGNGFAYDDLHIVVNDESLGSLASLPERLARPWWPEAAGREMGLWRPVSTAALALQRVVVGLEPLLFHAVNVGLHAVGTALVVLVAGTLIGAPAAFAAGLLFAIHPVHVEAVANVVGIAELLSATFYLGACLLFLRRTGGEPGRRGVPSGVERSRTGLTGGAVLALCGLYALAFLSKESAVTLPAALVLLDLIRRPVPVGRVGRWLAERARLLLALVGTAALVFALRVLVLGSVASPEPPLGAHLLDEIPRIWTLGVIWFEYLRLLVAPFSLSVDYSPDVIPVLTVWTPRALAGIVLVVALLLAAWVAWRRSLDPPADEPAKTLEGPSGDEMDRRGTPDSPVPVARLPAFALLWIVVTVAPVSNVSFLSGVLLAERTLYLPSVGFAVAVGAAFSVLVRRRRSVALALGAAVVILFVLRSWTRTTSWESTETVFATLIEEHPEAGRGLWALGDALTERGEREAASAAYREAIARLDSSYRLLMELGWKAVEREDYRLGEYLIRRARDDRPEQPSAWRRLAILYTRQERHGEVVEAARGTVRRAPRDVASWHLLASSLTALGRWSEAIEARSRVIELGEDPWQQWLPLARLHLTVGDTARAREAYEEALGRAEEGPDRRFVEGAFVPFEEPPGGDSSR